MLTFEDVETMPDPDIGDLRILILDDNANDRARIRDGLVDLGIADVRMANDPLAALDAMRARAVDVLVTERYLSFVRFLRTDRKRPASHVPIVMVSFHSRQADVHEARDAGVDEFLAKPVDAPRLLDRIVAAVGRSRPFRTGGARIPASAASPIPRPPAARTPGLPKRRSPSSWSATKRRPWCPWRP